MPRPGEELAASLLDPALYQDDPFPLYARLRAEAPVAWCPDPGFWAVSLHRDVSAAGTNPGLFRSSEGILVEEISVNYDNPPTMMHTDPPEHTRYRRLVQPGFKPSVIRQLEDQVRSLAKALIDPIEAGQVIDIVPSVSVPFPLQIICRLLGMDPDQWPRFYQWSEAAIPGANDWSAEKKMELMTEMWVELSAVAQARRTEPRDDVVSALAHSAPGAEELSEAELSMFLIQLLVAGNETTRNLLSGGLAALAERPDQWARLKGDRTLIPVAVEELLRWTTPVISFMRTATTDTELSGQEIGAGEHILLLYAAANRDFEAFGTDADMLRIDRDPNPHLSFGFGPHFCLGAALARMEARVVLEELLDRFSEIELAGAVERAPSSVIAGVRSAPLVFTA
jgi:cytochrome P450